MAGERLTIRLPLELLSREAAVELPGTVISFFSDGRQSQAKVESISFAADGYLVNLFITGE